jgi:transcriptional regulator with XRE-family HTH domain
MDALRQYLHQHNITQSAFAAEMGVSQPTVSGWLSGEQFPTGRRLKEISNKTGVPIDRLLDAQPRERRA